MTHGLGPGKPGPRAAKPITPPYVENNYRIEVKITFMLIAYLVLLCEFFWEISIFQFCRPLVDIYWHPLLSSKLTKHEIKIAGYWPSSLFGFYGAGGSRGQQRCEKERGQYPAMLTKQAWSIKNLLYGQKDNFFLQYQHGHLTHVPDTDNVKQKKNNHETISNRFYPEPTWEWPILPS